MSSEAQISLEVAYARPERQVILPLTAQAGITLRDAIVASGILEEFPEIDLEAVKVGIFGKAARMDAALRDGDRVEIYRPLIADPKEARKKRAAEGKGLKNRARKAPAKASKKEDE